MTVESLLPRISAGTLQLRETWKQKALELERQAERAQDARERERLTLMADMLLVCHQALFEEVQRDYFDLQRDCLELNHRFDEISQPDPIRTVFAEMSLDISVSTPRTDMHNDEFRIESAPEQESAASPPGEQSKPPTGH